MTPELTLFFAWVTAVTSVASVVLAGLFGVLTLRATKTANDASQRANIVANPSDGSAFHISGGLSGSGTLSATGVAGPAGAPDSAVSWAVSPVGEIDRMRDQDFALTNRGPGKALGVEISGLTTLDTNRIHPRWPMADDPSGHSIGPDQSLRFQWARRFTASGPGTLVATWREPDDPEGSPLRLQRFPLQ